MLFKDLHKTVDDLFTKDWPHENKYEVENNWRNGAFSFKNKLNFGGNWAVPSFALTGPVDSGSVKGVGKAPVTVNEISYESKAFKVTHKIDSEGKGSEDLKLTDLGIAGLSASVKS